MSQGHPPNLIPFPGVSPKPRSRSQGNLPNPDPAPGGISKPSPHSQGIPTCCMCPRTFFRQSKTPLPSSE